MHIHDLNQRNQALDISQSFIVQAPAGSGKTSLLTQRFLALLVHANNPEEIVAITFTKKAAAEIKHRIINALTPTTSFPPDDYHAKISALAHQARERNQQQHWQLLENPNRLRIQTIDALSYAIVRSSPYLPSKNNNIPDNSTLESYYLNAVKALLNTPSQALTNLMLHLNNDLTHAENLLVSMLKKREQWLPLIVATKNNSTQLKTYLESSLTTVVNENIARCKKLLAPFITEIIPLAIFAAQNLQLIDFIDNFICMVTKHYEFIANLLLTQREYQWRKIVDIRNGFPAASSTTNKNQKTLFKQQKEKMLSLLERLENHEPLRQSLEEILHSPNSTYTTEEWDITLDLCEILTQLTAELKLIFQQEQATDYAEILMAADDALGEATSPSILALNLDYKIQHLLIDEFQDTSQAQYRLIEKLLAGWQPGDGRTLFLVGDPMQSIYRFRQAEVGLFLRAQTEKIADIKLTPITLTTNFRSEKGIIDWINLNFQKILPANANINFGAIPFTRSTAANDIVSPNNVVIQLFNDAINEAQYIAQLIATFDSQETTAILVRSRTHLRAIFDALNNAHLTYQAIDLKNLNDNPIVQDLFALTRALLDPTDRIAWLAILRAPFCGLSLKDLHAIANGPHPLIIENLNLYSQLNLTKYAQEKLAQLVPIISHHLTLVLRKNLSALIQDSWLALGGEYCVDTEERENAELFFALLHRNQMGGTIDLKLLVNALDSLCANNTASSNLQIMTIHKAKGMQFDHVIIPESNRAAQSDDKSLLLSAEYINPHQGTSLLLAPLANIEETSKIYDYLWYLEQQKNRYETGRLLYVAMTRAKKTVHLTGNIADHANKKHNKINGLEKDSLLALLPYCVFNAIIEKTTPETANIPEHKHLTERLPADFILPKPNDLQLTSFTPLNDETTIGTVVHYYLEKISQEGLTKWTDSYIVSQKEAIAKNLRHTGCWNLETALTLTIKALQQTINDDRGRWILSADQDAASEYKISTVDNDVIKHLVIDRTFVENNTRWIIDYKITLPTSNLEEFIASQTKLYREQLQQYSHAFSLLDSKPIRLGLYFPLFKGWKEIINNHNK